MKNQLQYLKSKAEELRPLNLNSDQKVAWPQNFKQEVIHLIKQHSLSHTEVSKAIGISPSTVYSWLNGKNKKKDSFKKVKIADQETSSITTLPLKEISVHWDIGIHIKGLSFEELESLLKQGLI